MLVAIYSGGPKLEETWRGGRHDIGIAINRAAFVVPRTHWEWLCAGDFIDGDHPWTDYPIPDLGYCTRRPITCGGRECVQWSKLRHQDIQWSISAALLLAGRLLATEIEVYGHNQVITDAYTPRRAHSESVEVRDIVDNLTATGTTVDFRE